MEGKKKIEAGSLKNSYIQKLDKWGWWTGAVGEVRGYPGKIGDREARGGHGFKKAESQWCPTLHRGQDDKSWNSPLALATSNSMVTFCLEQVSWHHWHIGLNNFMMGGCPVHDGMISKILSLYTLDDRTNPIFPVHPPFVPT